MFKDAIITAQGLELDAKILAGHASAIFTGIKIGDGVYAGTEDLTTFTAMRSIRQEFVISSVSIIDNNTVRLRSVVNNTGIANGYYMSELGVFAQDPDKGEILYSIALGVKNKMDYQPSELELPGASSTIDTLTAISNSKAASIKLGMGAAASAEDLEELRKEKVDLEGGDISETVIESLEPIDTKYPVPSAGESTKVFMGKVKKYIENTKPLDADMMIYVATTGNDTTGTGESTAPYKTVTYAISKVPKDLSGYTATINIADGAYDEAVMVAGYSGGYLVIKRNGAPELNTLCNVKSIRLEFCSNVSIRGLNFTNTSGLSISANLCEFIDMDYCQSVVATATDETSFYLSGVSVGRIGNCRSLNHDVCLRSYLSNVVSYNWAGESLGKSYGIVSEGGRVTKANAFQPTGLITPNLNTIGGITVSYYGAKIGTLESNVDLYVATTGSDTTGQGTSAKPYKTIQYAINTLPRDLGGCAATIRIADGTYAERLVIIGFYNGRINLKSSKPEEISSVCNIPDIIISDNSALVDIRGINFTTTTANGIFAVVSHFVIVVFCRCVLSSSWGGFSFDQTRFEVVSCVVSNKGIALMAHGADGNSRAWNPLSTNNTVGIHAEYGSIIRKDGTQPQATVPERCYSAGSVINANGTQISNMITSGLSCTWGNLVGGYIRHGNINGTAMVTIQLAVTLTTALTIGQHYTIDGFPTTVIDTGVCCHAMDIFDRCHLSSNGTMFVRVKGSTAPGNILVFNCTYLHI